ncbi:MAG: hypothetical protein H0V70_15310 [Ktedonobacteraceae bacterium]|nr:hypothetical protein [Ktedonobacteraceae bacterium]
MARSKPPARRAIAFSVWLYSLFLYAYPASFRSVYGMRMLQVFRDSCRDTLQQRGLTGLIVLWSHVLSDLVITVFLERWHILKESIMANIQHFPQRLWVALIATVFAFAVSLIASLNLYQLEDTSRLTQAAYSASPLLRFSYDGIYLTALAAGVIVCTIVGYALIQSELLVSIGLIIVALLVVFGGFGGLLVRHPTTFLAFFAAFFLLLLMGFLIGRFVATRARRTLGQRPAAVLGACVSAGSVLFVNVSALVLHTLLLNPVSHALYMQGQIEGTHLNFSLISMGVAFLALFAYMVSLVRALRLPAHQ